MNTLRFNSFSGICEMFASEEESRNGDICEAKKTAVEVEESAEISGRVVPTTWKEEKITPEIVKNPTKFDLHWCKYGTLKYHHWSRRKRPYF